MTRHILMILTMIAAVLFCFLQTHYNAYVEETLMKGKQNCSLIHTNPVPTNCAGNTVLAIIEKNRLATFAYNLCVVSLILAYITVLIVMSWRSRISNETGTVDFLKMPKEN